MTTPTPKHMQRASWIMAGIAMIGVLQLHLLSALLMGLLAYELIHMGGRLLERRLSSRRARIVTVILLAILVVGGLVLGGSLTAVFFRGDSGHLSALAQKMAEILEDSRRTLPPWVVAVIPDSVEGIKTALVEWLREHVGQVQLIGKDAGVALAHVLIGLIVGTMLALREEIVDRKPARPLVAALTERARRLADAFRRIVFAQVRISALNTLFTAAYLLLVLPMLGIPLPLIKTMIALTFFLGLLPVIGNLLSNSIIVVVSLSHSPQTAMLSLGYLVVIHKLEYFLNARIVGTRISAQAWELLLAMLAMEAAFGLPGIVAAPVFYAWIKQELMDVGLV
jgi:predicted PurR-regulated permease PerM